MQYSQQEQGQSVVALCRYFGVSRAGYYKHQQDKILRRQQEHLIVEMIQHERRQQPRLGSKKLYSMHKDDIHKIDRGLGRDKFIALLGRHDLLVRRRRRRARTTCPGSNYRDLHNLVKDLELTAPNQVWVSDITYLSVPGDFVYLSLITDKYSRKIVGWELSTHLGMSGCIKSLQKAFRRSRPGKGLIHHSDRGRQYLGKPYRQLLGRYGARVSVTEENHCYENGLAERVNGILKEEYLLNRLFVDYNDAYKACRHAIEMYNTRRPHWALGLKTPDQVHRCAA